MHNKVTWFIMHIRWLRISNKKIAKKIRGDLGPPLGQSYFRGLI